jgi:RimJ/RimL family protein N-acetyltransferase
MHADFQAWIERCGRVEASEESHPFVIVDARSGELLGSIELHAAAGSVGYWIAPGARNRGIATAALRLICDWWRERPLRLTTHVDNTASQRVAQKAGFVRTGTEQHDPRFADGSAEAAVFRLD